jgi:hypothetical protein
VAENTCCWSLIEGAITIGADESAPLHTRIQRVVDSLRALASTGNSPEFLSRFLVISFDTDLIRAAADKINNSIATVATLAVFSGMAPLSAQTYAADWVATLQGSLVLLAFVNEPGPFSRTLQRLLDLPEGALASH